MRDEVQEGGGEMQIMAKGLHLDCLQQRGTGGHQTGEGPDLTTLRSAGYSVARKGYGWATVEREKPGQKASTSVWRNMMGIQEQG